MKSPTAIITNKGPKVPVFHLPDDALWRATLRTRTLCKEGYTYGSQDVIIPRRWAEKFGRLCKRCAERET